jgi:hypothetical protein
VKQNVVYKSMCFIIFGGGNIKAHMTRGSPKKNKMDEV